ncbi:MAG TPA: PaaI family thioesterase [Solirubrobacterales bacterium]|jgi:1,4-dihydroxy-2-naphthoyl-CoA hydrolase|nr:PaaI family thioesterase [Solirubrobacterales bacterium]
MSSPESLRPDGFAAHIGVEWAELDPDHARATIAIEDHHRQPYGIVHGGVFAALAESLCSAATYAAVMDDGMVAMGQANDTSFVRPITGGMITARAKARSRGRTTWVWDVDILDDEERLCAMVRMTIAVRPRRD